jgi:hypothetical protein
MQSKNHRQYLCACKHKTNLQNYKQKIKLEKNTKKYMNRRKRKISLIFFAANSYEILVTMQE